MRPAYQIGDRVKLLIGNTLNPDIEYEIVGVEKVIWNELEMYEYELDTGDYVFEDYIIAV